MKIIIKISLILLSLNLCYGQYYQSTNISNTNEDSDHSYLLINSKDEMFAFWVENASTIYYKHNINGSWSAPIPIITIDPELTIKELSANLVQDTCHIFYIEADDMNSYLKHGFVYNENIGDFDTLLQYIGELSRLESVNNQNSIHVGFYQDRNNPYSYYYDIAVVDYPQNNLSIVDSSESYQDYTMGYDSNSTLWIFWFGPNGEIYSRHLINTNTWSERDATSIAVLYCKDIDCCFNYSSQLFNLSLAGDIATADTYENGLFFVEGYDQQWSETETIIEQTSFTGRTRYSEYPQIVVNSKGKAKIFFEDDYSDEISSYNSISIAERDSQNNWINYNVLPSSDQSLHSTAINSEDTIYITYKEDENVFFAYEDNPLELLDTKNINLPKSCHVDQNYPNPFNPVTTIRFGLSNSAPVEIKIFDNLGREISTILQERKAAGYHQVLFDGAGLASGVYFYRIVVKGNKPFVKIRKMLLVK